MFYTIADVFVLPSTFEPWGLVINEAMNFNLPVVVSDKVGCASDLVKNDFNGYIYDVNDDALLADCIINSLNNSVQMGENSYEIIKTVDFDQICRAVVKSIDSVLAV